MARALRQGKYYVASLAGQSPQNPMLWHEGVDNSHRPPDPRYAQDKLRRRTSSASDQPGAFVSTTPLPIRDDVESRDVVVSQNLNLKN